MNPFQRFLQVLNLVSSFYPLLIQIIDALEMSMPTGGNGRAKLEALKATIEGAWGTVQDFGVSFTDAWPALERAVAAIVAFRNVTGLFKKSPPATAQATTGPRAVS